ncbi:phosphoserine phosphatase SerB [Methanolobus psychrotolerans]|uniref:phosphoserine phosphatase SerB n=1 Tax=Methanolobus psychrotolerans TaxID=1874706 RepID=UPI001A91DC97|nr:phosphoserine phosphatase SerB [Methanolobus psychrotolerans]
MRDSNSRFDEVSRTSNNSDRIKLVVFDMDSTLIDAETIDELAHAAGVGDKVALITERAMHGEMDYSDALLERVRLLRGLPLDKAHDALDKMPFMPGAKELVNYLKSRGYKTAMISGGFTIAAERVGEALGIDHVVSNELLIDDGRLTGEVRGPLTGQSSKEHVLEIISRKYGIEPDECIVVGDGANDICIFKRARYAIAFNSKPILREHADIVITEKNLEAVIPVIQLLDPEKGQVSCIRDA